MMKSDYLENKVLDAVFNNVSLAVATPYVSLHTADPGEAGSNEVTGGSYIRKSGSFAAAASGHTETDASISYPTMPACSVVAIGIWDAESVGNFLWSGWLGGFAPKAFICVDPTNNDLICDTHGYVADDRIVFSAEDVGTIPTGLTAGTIYWVISTGLTTNQFRVSATQGGAAIDITANGSGKCTKVTVKTVNAGDTFQINSGDLDVYDY